MQDLVHVASGCVCPGFIEGAAAVRPGSLSRRRIRGVFTPAPLKGRVRVRAWRDVGMHPGHFRLGFIEGLLNIPCNDGPSLHPGKFRPGFIEVSGRPPERRRRRSHPEDFRTGLIEGQERNSQRPVSCKRIRGHLRSGLIWGKSMPRYLVAVVQNRLGMDQGQVEPHDRLHSCRADGQGTKGRSNAKESIAVRPARFCRSTCFVRPDNDARHVQELEILGQSRPKNRDSDQRSNPLLTFKCLSGISQATLELMTSDQGISRVI